MWKPLLAAFAAFCLVSAKDETTLLQVNSEVEETFSFSELMKSSRGQASMIVPAYLKHMATDAWVENMKQTINRESLAKFVDKHSKEVRKGAEGALHEIKKLLQNSEAYKAIIETWSQAMAELRDPEIRQFLERHRRAAMESNVSESLRHAWKSAPHAHNGTQDFTSALKHLKKASFLQEGASIPDIPNVESARTLWCPYSICKVETGWEVFSSGALLYYPNTDSAGSKYVEYVYIAPQTCSRSLYDPADESQTIKEFSLSRYRIKLRVETGWTFEPEYRAVDLGLPWVYSHGMWLQQPNGWPIYVNRTEQKEFWKVQDDQKKGLGALIDLSAGMRDQHYTDVTTQFRGGFMAVAPLKTHPSRVQPGDHFWDFQYSELASDGHTVTSIVRGRESFRWNIGGVFWGFIFDSTQDHEVDPEEDMG